MNSRNLIGGLLAGAAVGVAIGLLLAPKSGKQMRSDLISGSRKLTDNLMGTVDDSMDMLKSKFNSGVDEVVKKGRETVTGFGEKVRTDGKI